MSIYKTPKVLRNNEEVEMTYKAYESFKDDLKDIYEPKYYVSTAQPYKNSEVENSQEMSMYSMTAWTDFQPTIFPVCDYIMIMLFDEENGEKYFNSYLINQKELFDLVTTPWEIVFNPVLHYVMDRPNDEIQKKILNKAVFIIRRKAIDESTNLSNG